MAPLPVAVPLQAGPQASPIAEAVGWAGPVRALGHEPGCLAVIAATAGPSYRDPGAVMALLAEGGRVGSLSSGCIEADLAQHGARAHAAGRPRRVRYGADGPADLPLPCGGALEVLLTPVNAPDQRQVLAGALAAAANRESRALRVDAATGAMALGGLVDTAGDDGAGGVVVPCRPEIAICVLGRGVEAQVFALLATAAGYPVRVQSPDAETRAVAAAAGATVATLPLPGAWTGDLPDARTAVVLFFHDHDWEPPLLARALASPAFFVGAQGSLRAHGARLEALAGLGVAPADLARLRAPLGLIPSARDPRLLAISVLADIASAARALP